MVSASLLSDLGVIFIDKGVNVLLVHGWLMWGAWSVLGLFQVISLRYLRPLHCKRIRILRNLNMALHIGSGIAIFGITIAMSI